MSTDARILFMGTPEFALPALRALIGSYSIVGVVTQPDRPAGRGRVLHPPPVKELAVSHSLPIYQPKTLRTPDSVAHLTEWRPDVIITAATGHILTPEVLAIPTHGTLNVHASLLPRWRGAAPIQAAILAGDTETGVTIMCTDQGLDTGPILSQRVIPIEPRETAASLHDRLAELGADLLMETLPRWLSGALQPAAQPAEGVTIARQVRKDHGLIDWTDSAAHIDRQVRAYTPWPGAFTFWNSRRLKIVSAFPLPSSHLPVAHKNAFPGTVVRLETAPAVVTGDGLIRLDQLQVEGKRVLSGMDFVHGQPDLIGAALGT